MAIQFVLLPLFVEVALTFGAAVLDGVLARRRDQAQAGQNGRRRARAVELAAARAADQQQLPQPIPASGSVLRADHAGDRHRIRPTSCSSCWLGCSCCPRLVHAYIHTGTNYVRIDSTRSPSACRPVGDVARSSRSASCWRPAIDAGGAARRRHRSFRQSRERTPAGGRRAQELGAGASFRRLRRPRRHRRAGL